MKKKGRRNPRVFARIDFSWGGGEWSAYLVDTPRWKWYVRPRGDTEDEGGMTRSVLTQHLRTLFDVYKDYGGPSDGWMGWGTVSRAAKDLDPAAAIKTYRKVPKGDPGAIY